MNIVIVAGGLGTRFKELSVFPKILLPTKDNDSILNELLSGFNNNNKFYIVINSKYYDMVHNYITVNKTKELLHLGDLQLISTDKCNGSLNSLASVYELLPKEDVLFVWSDIIIPKDALIENKIDKTTNIVFTCGNSYRYKYDGVTVEEVADCTGNVPGIYYFYSLPNIVDAYNKLVSIKTSNIDLIDFIQQQICVGHNNYTNIALNKIIEYKDLDTYKQLLKGHKINLNQTRFFNSITIDKENNTVTKSAINSDYNHIISDEYKWYTDIEKCIGNGVISPKLLTDTFNGTSFTMEYLKGYIPLHQFISIASEDDVLKVYANIKQNLHLLESSSISVDNVSFKRDIEKEMKTKVIDRCDKISNMLLNYDKGELTNILDKVVNTIITNNTNPVYTVCHGDLNGSNIMVNTSTFDVKFIDPRGYFGFSKFYGWPDYEYSKLLYCLYGYDKFNLTPQIYGEDVPEISKYVGLISYLNKDIYKLVVGVIYVALAGYISQDIMKANIAYEYGLKLIKEYYGEQ
ncbi:MAG: sugar phosphate nucleotidyltransferase [Candidatus Gastranaerophilaceae bacterium]